MTFIQANLWQWQSWNVAWNQAISEKNSTNHFSTVLVHGFGACKEHWRNNQLILAQSIPCYAIDLIGFGESSQPESRLIDEDKETNNFIYCFDSWGSQLADFCIEVVKKPVLLIGNSIGGVVSLKAAHLLQENCIGVTLINCAQRQMDDKRLIQQPKWMHWTRPYLKSLVRNRWLSKSLFRNAAQPSVIRQVLKKAYPTGNNVDDSLINILQKPSQRPGASEAFRGFINLFDDHLAPDLMSTLDIPVNLIWGECDPWEPLEEAQEWANSIQCIRSLNIIPKAGHCPHDESPEKVNEVLIKIIQDAK